MKSLSILLAAVSIFASLLSDAATIQGTVRFDQNRDGWPGPEAPGIPGMLVSDGFGFAETDAEGKYTLTLHERATTIYVQRNDLYTADVTKFWHRITPGRKTYDFLMEKSRPVQGDTLDIVVVGDTETQETMGTQDLGFMRQVRRYIANHPEIDLFLNAGDISAGSSLGMETQRDFVNFSTMGIPVVYACGNHDIDFRGRGFYGDKDPFVAIFGPWWESFELGGFLFVTVPIYNSWGAPISYDMRDCGDWLRALCERYPDKKKILFCHDLPDLVGQRMDTHSEPVDFDQENFVCAIYGHKHMNIVKKYPSGRKAFSVATPNKGGAGCFTQCFRTVHIERATGKATSELFFNNAEEHLALVLPQKTADAADTILVDAYDGGDEIVSVTATSPGQPTISLKRISPAAWQETAGWKLEGNAEITLAATTKSGKRFSHTSPVAAEADAPEILWTTQLPAAIAMADLQLVNHSLVVAVADDENAEKGGIYSLDPDNGQILWFYPTEYGVRNNVATDGTRIFAIDTRANIHAVDAMTGEGLWRNPSDPGIVSPAASGIICHNGIVAGGYGRHLRGIDATTGKTIWRNTSWEVEERTPAEDKIAIAGESILVISRLNGLYRHDLATGRVLWHSKQWLPNATALVDGDDVWLIGSANDIMRLRLEDGKTLATIKPFPCKSATAVPVRLDNGLLLVASGNKGLGAIDPSTGKEAWRFLPRASIFPTGDYITGNPPAVTATPLLLQQALWVAANDGFLYRLDPDDGKALRQLRVGMPILNKPCADSERIYVSDCCGRVMAVRQ